MSEKQRTTMVPYPSHAIVPERDVNKKPVLEGRFMSMVISPVKAK